MLKIVPILLYVASAALAQTPPPASEFKITSDVELVLLDVGVSKAKGGGSVSGLAKENFAVYENGVRQTISQFSNADVPVTIGLVIDESGSMGPKRAEVVTAGLVFAGASNPADEIFVVSFNDNVRRALPEGIAFTDDIKLLRTALMSHRPEGRTALYDAVIVALRHLGSGAREKKALILVSDGGDNISKHTLKDVLRFVHESRATIYTVGIFEPGDPDSNPEVLKSIAEISGGESYLPRSLDEVVPICRTIAKNIRSRYTIGYVPVHVGDKASMRSIQVAADAPGEGKLRVRTRTSYMLPGRLEAGR